MRIKKRTVVVYVFMTAAGAAVPAAVWLLTSDGRAALVSGVLALFVCFSSIVLQAMNNRRTERLLIDLSALIASLSDLTDVNVFPENEDTLLSKIQAQVQKLVSLLRAQNAAVQKEKDDIQSLVSDIAHQIKTPIAAVMTYADLAGETDEPRRREEYIAALRQSLGKLLFLTESLIKMSRLESGVIALSPRDANLTETVLDAVGQVFLKANAKNIEIVFDTPDVPYILSHDPKWTAEAFFNILDNSVKYTPPGGKVTVRLSAYDMYIRTDISDTGVGIPEEEITSVFKRFYRGSNTQDTKGAGIGLYLSRQIIAGQHRFIKATSEKTGSVVSVFLLH